MLPNASANFHANFESPVGYRAQVPGSTIYRVTPWQTGANAARTRWRTFDKAHTFGCGPVVVPPPPPLPDLALAPPPKLVDATATFAGSVAPHPSGAIPKPPLHPAIKAMHVSRCRANYAWYLRADAVGQFRCGGGHSVFLRVPREVGPRRL